MPVFPTLPALVLDSSAAPVAAGVWAAAAPGGSAAWARVEAEAGAGLFEAAERVLDASGLAWADLRSVAFCEGPGSVLGIRIAAVAIRTWQALPRPVPIDVVAYASLALVAADLLDRGESGPFAVVHDGRRGSWNVLEVTGAGRLGTIRRVAAEDAAFTGRRVFHPAGFPLWQPLPPGAREVDYRPERLPALAGRFDLLAPASAPDAFLVDPPSYRKWKPAVAPPTAPGR